MNALFVCSQNKLRSPTAEQLFSTYAGVEADSAGLNNDAVTPLSIDQIEWADVIFVMEKSHLNRLRGKFKRQLGGKRVVCLNIPDDYDFMQDELVQLLKARAGRYLTQ